jgi:DNA-binding transcriptional LysR family regulator
VAPKLEWLEAFAEFGEDLNFTHAARRLHLSQPALHAQIRKLSEALGVTLYERRGRRLVLTEAGIEVLRFSRQMHERSRVFVESVGGRRSTRPVVLAAGEGAFLYLLGPAIRRFVRHGPVPLRLLTRAAEPAVEAVVRGDAHLAVAVLSEVPEGLEGSLIADVRHVAVVPRKHPLSRRRRIPLAALSGERLVVPPPGSRLRQSLAAFFASAGHDLKVAVEASGWEPMLHFAGLGVGVAVVNGCCRIPGGLVAVPIEDLPRVRYYLLHAPASLEDERVAALRETVLHSTAS